jgi:hypothetical protein
VGTGLALPWSEPLPFAEASTRTRLGAFARQQHGQTPQAAVRQLESLIGKKLAVTRHYQDWHSQLPGTFIDWSARGGRKPYVAWHSTPISWRRIASGGEDSKIRAQARSIRQAGYPMYFTFHHEPENDTALGSPADFVRAFTHVRKVFDSNGATNLTWVVVLMASTFEGGHGGPGPWLPADSTYEMLGVDGYNRFPCLPNRDAHPWISFERLFGSAHAQAVTRGKRLFVGEWATVEQTSCGYKAGDPLAKSVWIAGARATMKAWGDVGACVYTHAQADFMGFRERFWVDTSKPSLNAFRHLAADASFS